MHTPILSRMAVSILCLLLLVSSSCAEDARYTLEDVGLELGSHSIHYPRFTDSADDGSGTIASSVNEMLLDALPAKELSARMAAVLSSPVSLISTWDGFISGELLSVHMHASGPLERERYDSADYAVLIDLSALETVPLNAFFTDPDKARQAIEEKLEWEIGPELSPHLANADLLPLTETYHADRWALTLYYPSSRFMTLSGNAGQVRIFWYELQDLLIPDEDSVPGRLGILSGLAVTSSSAENIQKSVDAGSFPSVPAAVGDSLKSLADQYPLLHDPDNIEGARVFELEGACMQNIQFLTDTLSVNGYENSVVEAIRADAMNLFGLCTGITTRSEWQKILGDPDASVALDADSAELYRLEPGTSDYYRFGAHTLRLHADEFQVLQAIFIQ